MTALAPSRFQHRSLAEYAALLVHAREGAAGVYAVGPEVIAA